MKVIPKGKDVELKWIFYDVETGMPFDFSRALVSVCIYSCNYKEELDCSIDGNTITANIHACRMPMDVYSMVCTYRSRNSVKQSTVRIHNAFQISRHAFGATNELVFTSQAVPLFESKIATIEYVTEEIYNKLYTNDELDKRGVYVVDKGEGVVGIYLYKYPMSSGADIDLSGITRRIDELEQNIGKKQDKLVSGTNIKTINGQSILGEGNIVIEGGGGNTDDSVTGIKGNAESEYRKGNVNITPENIGLGNVDNTKDDDKTVKHAVSADSAGLAGADAAGNIITETYATKEELSQTNSELSQARTDASTANTTSSEAKDIAEQAARDAEIAKNAVKTLEGLADTTTAQETLAAQVVQIEQNKSDILANKQDADEKLTELGSMENNPEYARAYTDAEGRFLWGIKRDGSIEFAKGVPTPIKNYIIEFVINQIDNAIIPEIEALKETYEQYLKEYESPEWARVIVDAEGKVLWGIRQDGSVEFTKGVPSSIKKYIDSLGRNNDEEIERINQLVIGLLDDVKVLTDTYHYVSNPEWACAIMDSDGKILEGIKKGGKKYFPKQEMFEKYNDVEGRTEITLDAEGRIVSYRDSNGVKHEHKQHTEEASFGSMFLSDKNGLQIAESLKKVGFTTDVPSDFSLSDSVELPIPRVAAKVRLLVSRMPTSKTADIEGYLEYNDKDGNYFKKAIVLNSQGSSSMSYIRPDGSQGNLGVDFVDCEIKFGTWVPQDSFHIKKYYIDAFRGQCVVGYHLMEQVYQTHAFGEKKPYDTIIQNNSLTDSFGKFKKDFNTGALCHPDGFPVVIYVNTGGEDIYYGVYAWCLKKHRDNYYCDKNDSNNIILDGLITTDTLFNGNIQWHKFEIRNPKDLIDIEGNEYDGENPKELSDVDALSAKVKANIVRLSGVNAAMIANNSRETFEQYFLPKYYIDYYIVSQVLYNLDGFGKNWIWCTWDGKHWTPTLYDVDSIFGMMPIGTLVNPSSITSLNVETITNYLSDLYSVEIRERYKELRDKKVFDVDNIVGLLENWLKRIGYQNLKDDLEKFNQTPSYRNSNLNDSNWKVLSYSWDLSNNNYDSTKTYAKGEKCYSYGYQVEAIVETTGVPPFSELYPNHPQGYGFYNSLSRVKNWIGKRLEYLDSIFNYSV